MRADERERLDERARDPRVEHVADDRHVEPLEAPECVPHRVEVEQRLGRVLVLAVAGVDDVRVEYRATSCGAPTCGCRMTITSGS